MYNHLCDGLIKLEPIDNKPGYRRMMLDPTVRGCHYLIEDKDYYLKEVPLMDIAPKYHNSLLRIALKSAILVDKGYWIIDYVYHATEFEVWALKSKYSQSQITDICEKLLSASVESILDENYQRKYGNDDGFGMMSIIFEDKIAPGLKVSECGELPNGIEASFLICDPDAILDELYGLNISHVHKSQLINEAKKLLAKVKPAKPKSVSAKMKAKQEKRLKNWNQSKKDKTDSQ